MKSENTNISELIFRSATFEGMADKNGFPTEEYLNMYKTLAANSVKNIITGFTYISDQGKAVHPGQAGIDSEEKVPYFKKVTDAVHCFGSRIYLQIAHTGIQTSKSITKEEVVGASNKRSKYFRCNPKKLSINEINNVIESFTNSAEYARLSGFDGIQLHAAHGYLIHQFLHPYINNRRDEFGINSESGIGDTFLRKIISSIRIKCGADFPILVKISASDDLPVNFSEDNLISLIKLLDELKVFAIEISYGTMENALNIFRGRSIPFDAILKSNFRYKIKNKIIRKFWKFLATPYFKVKVKEFSNMYNIEYAKIAKRYTEVPIICVGGFRKGSDILAAINNKYADLISLCRPFICEPDIINKFNNDLNYVSECINCNICAVMCDSFQSTRCYLKKLEE